MFLGAVVGHPVAVARARRAARLHLASLAASGYAGELAERSIGEGLLLWDGLSSHAQTLIGGEDQAAVLGGYSVDEPAWLDGSPSWFREESWGEFAAVALTVRDGTTRLEAMSDHAGTWPLYLAEGPGIVVVTVDPHYAAVAAGHGSLDTQGAYEVLAYGHALGAKTTIEGVTRLFPRQSVIASSASGVPKLRRIDRPPLGYVGGDEVVSTLDAYSALLAGIRRISVLDHFADATVQLSGGLDSRITAAALAEVRDERPSTVTLDLTDAAELSIAAEVSAALEYPHRVASLRAVTDDDARAGWLLTGGQVSVVAATGNILAYATANESPDERRIIIGGWPGDCLIGSYVPFNAEMLNARSRSAERRWADGRRTDWTQLSIEARGPRLRAVQTASRRALRDGLRRASGSTPAQRISHWAMFVRQPAFSYVSPAILTSHVLAVTPLVARPYLEQLLRLRARDIVAKNFYRRLLIERFPRVAKIPYAATGAPVDAKEQLPEPRRPTRHELYHRLPRPARSLITYLVALRDGRSPAPRAALRTSASAEVRFWDGFLDRLDAGRTVTLDGLVVDASRAEDLHIRGVGLSLAWTRTYLHEMNESIDHRQQQ